MTGPKPEMSLKLGVTGSGSTTGAFSSGQTFVVLGVHGHRQSLYLDFAF